MYAANHPDQQQHSQQHSHQGKNTLNHTTINHLIDLNQYQSASSQQIIVQFARNSYPLVGAVIQGNTIKGQFGYGEIQHPRNQRLIMLRNKQFKQVDKVSKILIVKSLLNTKKNQLNNRVEEGQNHHIQNGIGSQKNISEKQKNPYIIKDKNHHLFKPSLHNPSNLQDINQQKKPLQPQAEQQERFFSESSQSSQVQERQRRQAKNRLKKQQSISKSSSHRQQPSKISKNILKKKLKYLAQKK